MSEEAIRKKVLKVLETSEVPLPLRDIKKEVPEEGLAKALSSLREDGKVISKIDPKRGRMVWGLFLE